MLRDLRRGVTWTYTSMIAGAVLQLGITSVTARLLDPGTFGLVALANLMLRFGGYFAQMGVGRALIQSQNISVLDVRAAFTSSALLGIAVAISLSLVAPAWGLIFQEPNVVPVVRWLSLSFAANGLGATALALLRRELRFRSAALVEVVSYAFGYGAPALLLAYRGYGVWSLVIAAIGQAVVSSAAAYFLTRHPVRPIFSRGAHRRLFGFGARVSLISFLEFIGSTVDSLIIGRFGTASLLGLYNRAYMLASLPTYQVNVGISKVLFPVLSRGQGDLDAFRETLGKASQVAIRLTLPLGVGMAFAAPELVQVVLGSQWGEAVPILRLLAVGFAANVLATFPGIALESLGVLRGKGLVQGAFVVVLVAALLLSVAIGGFHVETIAAIITAAYIAQAVVYFILALRAGAFDAASLKQLLIFAVASIIVTGALTGSVLWLARASGLSDISRLATGVFAGAISLSILFFRDFSRAFSCCGANRVARKLGDIP